MKQIVNSKFIYMMQMFITTKKYKQTNIRSHLRWIEESQFSLFAIFRIKYPPANLPIAEALKVQIFYDNMQTSTIIDSLLAIRKLSWSCEVDLQFHSHFNLYNDEKKKR